MHGSTKITGVGGAVVAVVLLSTLPAHAQFSSGSTGALGAFAPVSNTVVTLPSDGILNYTTISIPSGVTVTFQANSANTSVTMLATGNVSIAGTIDVNGQPSVAGSSPGTSRTAGGLGGPGGSAGGLGGIAGTVNTMGGPGQGARGGNPGLIDGHVTGDGAYAGPTGFLTLIPLYGGSGGGGGSGPATTSGRSGAGGGGAIVIASTTQITLQSTGQIFANGGYGQLDPPGNCNWYAAGAGSGGAIRLVSPTVTVTTANTVQAVGGLSNGGVSGPEACVPPGAGPGRIRIECTTCSLQTTTPAASVSNTLGPITAASTPPLTNVPTVTISTVGGISAPGSPGGSYSTPDITIAAATINPVPVTLTATNVPVGTTFTVMVLPPDTFEVDFASVTSTGTFASSTATAQINLPYGRTSLLYVYASFTQVAGLFPLIDGEPVERVLVAAAFGEPSTTTLITRSGKIVSGEFATGLLVR